MLGGREAKDHRKSGHSAAECTEARSAEGVECNRCKESTYHSHLSFSFDALTSNPDQSVILGRTAQLEVAELVVTACK